MTAPGAIGFERVGKVYRGGRVALDDVSFELPAGGSLGLVGESGSGKTTCVRLALGLERPTDGRLTFNGAAYPASRSDLRPLRRQVGFVLQDPYDSLDPRMTIRDIVAEPLRIHGLPGWRGADGDRLVAEQLAAVGLPGADLRSYPARYSGGGRQRIAIARALISGPAVLICDEPTSSLDVSVQSQIVNLLLDARQAGNLSLLFVSHDLDLIGRVADTVAVMYGGQVVEIGPAEQIRRSPRHPYTKALHDAIPADHPARRRLAAGQSGAAEPAAGLAGGPVGCVFASRCAFADAQCRAERPALVAEQGRSYACFHPLPDVPVSDGPPPDGSAPDRPLDDETGPDILGGRYAGEQQTGGQ